ncbi:hypothetical protein WMY93_033218 [Mugilogobius chulae]|uniref:Uncharacterized protein n=1 Tax=Mugilogobius chulae TaxID=88201 RepID=A0AAW0MSK3_9GOBI
MFLRICCGPERSPISARARPRAEVRPESEPSQESRVRARSQESEPSIHHHKLSSAPSVAPSACSYAPAVVRNVLQYQPESEHRVRVRFKSQESGVRVRAIHSSSQTVLHSICRSVSMFYAPAVVWSILQHQLESKPESSQSLESGLRAIQSSSQTVLRSICRSVCMFLRTCCGPDCSPTPTVLQHQLESEPGVRAIHSSHTKLSSAPSVAPSACSYAPAVVRTVLQHQSESEHRVRARVKSQSQHVPTHQSGAFSNTS